MHWCIWELREPSANQSPLFWLSDQSDARVEGEKDPSKWNNLILSWSQLTAGGVESRICSRDLISGPRRKITSFKAYPALFVAKNEAIWWVVQLMNSMHSGWIFFTSGLGCICLNKDNCPRVRLSLFVLIKTFTKHLFTFPNLKFESWKEMGIGQAEGCHKSRMLNSYMQTSTLCKPPAAKYSRQKNNGNPGQR